MGTQGWHTVLLWGQLCPTLGMSHVHPGDAALSWGPTGTHCPTALPGTRRVRGMQPEPISTASAPKGLVLCHLEASELHGDGAEAVVAEQPCAIIPVPPSSPCHHHPCATTISVAPACSGAKDRIPAAMGCQGVGRGLHGTHGCCRAPCSPDLRFSPMLKTAPEPPPEHRTISGGGGGAGETHKHTGLGSGWGAERDGMGQNGGAGCRMGAGWGQGRTVPVPARSPPSLPLPGASPTSPRRRPRPAPPARSHCGAAASPCAARDPPLAAGCTAASAHGPARRCAVPMRRPLSARFGSVFGSARFRPVRCGDAGPARLCGAQLGTARCGAAAAEPIPPRRRPRPPRPPHPGLPDPPVQPRTAAEREGTDGRMDRGGTNGRGWDTRDLGHGYGDGDATTRGRLTGLGTDRRGQTDARMGGRAVGTAAAAQGNRTALRVHGSPTTTGTGPGLRSPLTARGCSPHKRLWGRRCAAGALALHPEQQQLKSAAAIKSSQQRSGAPAPKHQHGALAALFGDELTAAAAPLPPSPPPRTPGSATSRSDAAHCRG